METPLTAEIIAKISESFSKEGEVIGSLNFIAEYLNVPSELTSSRIRRTEAYSYDRIKNILTKWLLNNRNNATLQGLKNALQEMGLTKAAGNKTVTKFISLTANKLLKTTAIVRHIGKNYEDKASSSCPNHEYNILIPTQNFVGRKTELRQMKKWYDLAAKPVLLVSGMRGQGKTELVRKFLCKFKPKKHCAWLNGNGAADFIASLKAFIYEVKGRKETFEQTFNELCDEFFDEGKFKEIEGKKMHACDWLIIVDKVETVFERLEEFVEKAAANGTVFIVISQTLSTFPGRYENVKLTTLELKDSVRLLRKLLGFGEQGGDFMVLCELLNGQALALVEAAEYILVQREQNPSYTLLNYVNEYKAMMQDIRLPHHSWSKTEQDISTSGILRFVTPKDVSCSKCPEIALIILSLVKSDRITEVGFLELFDAVSHQVHSDSSVLKAGSDCQGFAQDVLVGLSEKSGLVKRDSSNIAGHRLIYATVLKTLKWDWIAEKIVEHFSFALNRNPGKCVLWGHLKQIWLHFNDRYSITRKKMFPVRLSYTPSATIDEPFLHESLQKAKQFLEKEDVSTLKLQLLADVLELQHDPSRAELETLSLCAMSIVKKSHSECFDILTPLYFTKLGVAEPVFQHLIQLLNGDELFLKIQLLLFFKLMQQGKLKEAESYAVDSEQLPLDLFKSWELVNLLNNFNSDNSFTTLFSTQVGRYENLQCVSCFCSILLKYCGLSASIAYKISEILCTVWSVQTVLHEMERFVNGEECSSEFNAGQAAKTVQAFSVTLAKRHFFKEATELLQKLQTLQAKVLGNNDISNFVTCSKLGRVLVLQGKYREGLAVLKDSANNFLCKLNLKSWKQLKKLALFMLVFGIKIEKASKTSVGFKQKAVKNLAIQYLLEFKRAFPMLMSSYSPFAKNVRRDVYMLKCYSDKLNGFPENWDERISKQLYNLIWRNQFGSKWQFLSDEDNYDAIETLPHEKLLENIIKNPCGHALIINNINSKEVPFRSHGANKDMDIVTEISRKLGISIMYHEDVEDIKELEDHIENFKSRFLTPGFDTCMVFLFTKAKVNKICLAVDKPVDLFNVFLKTFNPEGSCNFSKTSKFFFVSITNGENPADVLRNIHTAAVKPELNSIICCSNPYAAPPAWNPYDGSYFLNEFRASLCQRKGKVDLEEVLQEVLGKAKMDGCGDDCLLWCKIGKEKIIVEMDV